MSTPEAIARPAAEGIDDVATQRRRSRVLYTTGLAGLGAFCAYYGVTAKVEDPMHLYLGLMIAVLSALPSLIWAKRARYNLPIFEVFMLTSVNTYAIPLLAGHEQLQRFEPETLTTAAFLVLLYLVIANVTYFVVNGRAQKGAAWRGEIVSRDISRLLSYGMLAATLYTLVVQFTTWIPFEHLGILRAITGGLSNIACFIQSRRWGRGELTPQEKAVFALMLFSQIFFGLASLLLVNSISLLLLSALGYIAGAKKFPLVAFAVGLPVLAILHNGKSAMREQYWGPLGIERNQVTLGELPEFYGNWFTYGMRPPVEDPAKSKNAKLLERTSLFHMMCLVVSITPERQPYLGGDTYTHIAAQFIPRFFWPSKPSAHIATNKLAVYYGLQAEEDTGKTTVGFGLLTEAYANFGFMGVAGLALIFAAAFKKITLWSAESPILSYPGLFMIVLIAWSFMTEYTLSVWLSSLFQATVVVLGVPFVTRNIFR